MGIVMGAEGKSGKSVELEAVLTGADDHFYVFDKHFRYVEINESALRSLELDRQEVLGKTPIEVSAELGPMILSRCEEVVLSGKSLRFDMTFQGDASPSWFSVILHPVRDDQGDIHAIAGIGREVTDLKNGQSRLGALSRKMVEALEEERKRISRELHDGLGQHLVAILMEIEQAMRPAPKGTRPSSERLERAIKLIKEALEMTGEITAGLRPDIVENLGLDAALRSLVKDFGLRSGVKAAFSGQDIHSLLDGEAAIAFYRVVQEALTNVIRHADASEVKVTTRRADTYVSVKVRDNGCGFDPEKVDKGRSIGLLGMQERLYGVGGKLIVRSSCDRGTTIEARVPVL